ncbi:MAG: response regulator transcription factor [Acidobacteriia bacterium]|nr:response regulator transcription factor [Terriglobia bacterium]
MPVRILLADDHAILRQGLRRILESYPGFAVVAEAGTGLEAVRLAEQERPDVAVVDIAMKELNGVEATAQIRKASPSTAVLILSMHRDESYVIRSVRAGASGYILKDSVEDELIQAIHAVQKKGHFFSPAIAALVREGCSRARKPDAAADRYELLTRTEKVVYQMIAEGNSNKEIGARLNTSVHTVETHRAHIMEKMALHSVTELVLSAVRRGLVR